MHTLLQKTILATNTAEPLSLTPIKCAYAAIQQIMQNNGDIFVGDSSVAVNRGMILYWSFPFILEGRGANDIDLSEIYVFGTQGDIVNVLYYIF
jgi:hypothetical protein